MFYKCSFIFAIICVSGLRFSLTKHSRPKKLSISVYYESDDNNSKRFIVKQLLPAMMILNEHIDLQLVPFGRSLIKKHGKGKIGCARGPSQCFSNMVQDCALHLMNNVTDVEKVQYVACEMSTGASLKQESTCIEKTNLTVSKVEKCLTTSQGIQLQRSSEYLTSIVSPQEIPTITVNGAINQDVQDFGRVDLPGTLCNILRETAACARYYNKIALDYVLKRPHTFLTNYSLR